MVIFSPSFAVGALHGFKPLPDNIKYTALGLTTLGYYAKTLGNFETLARTLTPQQQFGALVCAAPAVAAFTWFSGKNVGKAFRHVYTSINEHQRPSELERPNGPQAQA